MCQQVKVGYTFCISSKQICTDNIVLISGSLSVPRNPGRHGCMSTGSAWLHTNKWRCLRARRPASFGTVNETNNSTAHQTVVLLHHPADVKRQHMLAICSDCSCICTCASPSLSRQLILLPMHWRSSWHAPQPAALCQKKGSLKDSTSSSRTDSWHFDPTACHTSKLLTRTKAITYSSCSSHIHYAGACTASQSMQLPIKLNRCRALPE